MSTIKEAIIVIPGSEILPLGKPMERLAQNLNQHSRVSSFTRMESGSPHQMSFDVVYGEGNRKHIDLYEVYWSDMINEQDPAKFKLHQKLIFGLRLIWFWVFSPVWKAIGRNKMLLFGSVMSGILVTAWFVSVIGLLITAIEDLLESPHLATLAEAPFWAILSAALSILPIAMILRVVGLFMNYIERESFRATIRDKVEQVMTVVREQEYDQITVLAHSMGSLIAVDYLAGYKEENAPNVRLVTIGAPISFLATNSPEIAKSIGACASNPRLSEWLDFYSHEDWLCSYEKAESVADRFHSEAISFDTNFFGRFHPKVHSAYWQHEGFLERLLGKKEEVKTAELPLASDQVESRV